MGLCTGSIKSFGSVLRAKSHALERRKYQKIKARKRSSLCFQRLDRQNEALHAIPGLIRKHRPGLCLLNSGSPLCRYCLSKTVTLWNASPFAVTPTEALVLVLPSFETVCFIRRTTLPSFLLMSSVV